MYQNVIVYNVYVSLLFANYVLFSFKTSHHASGHPPCCHPCVFQCSSLHPLIPPCLSVHLIYGPLDPVNPHPQFIRLYQ